MEVVVRGRSFFILLLLNSPLENFLSFLHKHLQT
jgi:hypothetical protein